MNKFAQNLHQQFVGGKINGAVFEYLQKFAAIDDTDAAIFDQHIDNLANWGAESSKDCQAYFDLYTNAQSYVERLLQHNLSEHDAKKLNKYAFLNRNQYSLEHEHNYFKLALDFIKDTEMCKHSHPNNAGIDSATHIRQPYDLEKWIETMRQIYNTAATNNLPLDKVAEQVVGKWDEHERTHFQRWMRYYQEGNDGKYNVKTAQFYWKKPEEQKAPDMKSVQDLMANPTQSLVDPTAAKKQRLDEARKKLRGRLKSIEELLEIYRDVLPRDTVGILRKDVFDLKEKILGLELKASLVDSIMRTSNKFVKNGFIEGANELKKIAQEVAEDKLPEVKEEVKVETKEEAPKEEKYVQLPEVSKEDGSVDLSDFSPATYRDALQKLEEVNEVLAERGVIRGLAAVDIILAQLGMASHFPKLSEAQSKLMEAFQYASPRVSEVIGLMRGSLEKQQRKPLLEHSAGKPRREPEDVVEIAEEVEKPVEKIVSGPPPSAAPASTPTPETPAPEEEADEFRIPSKHSIVPG